MRTRTGLSGVAVVAAAMLLGQTTALAEQARPAAPTVVFQAGTEGYDTFRIPAIVRTHSGALLAFAEGRRTGAGDTGDIDLVLKRSTDGGRTWGRLAVVGDNGPNTFGNPTPVVDPRTGRVVLLSTHNSGTATEGAILRGEVSAEQSRRVWVQHSDDEGRSWSQPTEITDSVKAPDWRWYATGPVHAVALRHGPHAGRLVAPANHSAAPAPGSGDTGAEPKYYGAHLIYSDDGGISWQLGAVDDSRDGVVNGNETTVAELPDGRLYVNSRDQNGTSAPTRAVAYSSDGGQSWDAPLTPEPQLVGPVVQGSTLQTSGRGPLLFAGPSQPTTRAGMAVRASRDGGAHWSAGLVLSPAPAAYSDLVELPARRIGLLYETGQTGPYQTITFRALPLAEILAAE